MFYPYNGILFGNKKEQCWYKHQHALTLRNYAKQKGPVTEDILYDSIYMKYPEQANPETKGRLVIAKDGMNKMEWLLTDNKYWVSFWSDEYVLKFENVGSCTTQHTKSHKVTY